MSSMTHLIQGVWSASVTSYRVRLLPGRWCWRAGFTVLRTGRTGGSPG